MQATASLHSIAWQEEILNYWLEHHHEHRFVIFLAPHTKLLLSSNQSKINFQIVVVKAPVSVLQLFTWYNIQLPLKLKKLKVDVLIQSFGATSFTTRRPQLSLIEHFHSKQKLNNWLPLSYRIYNKVFTKKWLLKATALIVIGTSSKSELVKQYPFLDKKTTVSNPFASPHYVPISFEPQQQTMDSYADGRMYFLFTGGNVPHHNLVGVLKAFSIFKKWQKSNMKLLIAGEFLEQPVLKDDVMEKLSYYKYKEDIVLLKDITKVQLALITASAYAVISPSISNTNLFETLNASQAGTPVIASNRDEVIEIAGTACQFVNPEDVDSIATEIKLLYKDEELRKNLVTNGKEQASKYSLKQTAETIWQVLQSSIIHQR